MSAELAPLGRRVAARVLDLLLLGWLAAVLVVEVEGRLFGGDIWARRRVDVDPSSFGTVLILVACVTVVEVLPTAIAGRTLGKAMTGLAVVREDADRPGALAAVIRATVLYGTLALPIVSGVLVLASVVLVLATSQRRAVHDRLASTTVIQVA